MSCFANVKQTLFIPSIFAVYAAVQLFGGVLAELLGEIFKRSFLQVYRQAGDPSAKCPAEKESGWSWGLGFGFPKF